MRASQILAGGVLGLLGWAILSRGLGYVTEVSTPIGGIIAWGATICGALLLLFSVVWVIGWLSGRLD